MTNYLIGCNYWASNAGAEMWVNFCESSIDQDMKTLAENGVGYIRVFPNWRDFQPVMPLYTGDNIVEYRLTGERHPTNKYYLDETAMGYFDVFCNLAQKHGLKIIVGLITGWMSGRLFVPPIMYGRNPYTDHTALLFQQKFITGFITRFKHKDEIAAWDLGNECNCMYPLNNREAAHNWTLTLSNCIRACDNTRPIISGMHNLYIEGTWTIEDQADGSDILTTHPYPYWAEYTRIDTYSDIRTLLHATCETKLYSDIGGKPCLVEEIGTMGPMNCDDGTSADFVRTNLYSNWAHGAKGLMWWCAHEQTDLISPPYSWNMCEVELGMTDRNGAPKPVLREFKAFKQFMDKLDFALPAAHEDGICILTKGQDHWGVAYMSYILAKQAGVNLRFAYGERELPESNVYLMPSVKGHLVMARERYLELIEKVKNGATLYISNDECILAEFNALTGLIAHNSRKYKRILKANGAEVLRTDADGNPVFTKFAYGKGVVYYLDYPLETMLLNEIDAFKGSHHEMYQEIFDGKLDSHMLCCKDRDIGVTQHFGEDKNYVVLVNYSGAQVNPVVSVNDKYKLVRQVSGNMDRIEPFGAVILEFE